MVALAVVAPVQVAVGAVPVQVVAEVIPVVIAVVLPTEVATVLEEVPIVRVTLSKSCTEL